MPRKPKLTTLERVRRWAAADKAKRQQMEKAARIKKEEKQQAAQGRGKPPA